ncbi:MAG: hypothetical protein K6G07_01530 [Lachnospiraceae bacterium]|nr:hypothetical protein [Lachnospiraceae bacterium]
MIKEVFELLMQVHEGMSIQSIGLIDGSKVEKSLVGDGAHQVQTTVKLHETDIGFAIFQKNIRSSYIYNDEITGETRKMTRVAIPYENITYMEFTDELDEDEEDPMITSAGVIPQKAEPVEEVKPEPEKKAFNPDEILAKFGLNENGEKLTGDSAGV